MSVLCVPITLELGSQHNKQCDLCEYILCILLDILLCSIYMHVMSIIGTHRVSVCKGTFDRNILYWNVEVIG